MSLEMLAEHFENCRYTHQSDVQYLERTSFFDRLHAMIISSLTKGEGKRRILDVGCGFAHFLMGFRDLGWETWGVERVVRCADYAFQQGVRVIAGTSFSEKHFPMEFFDVITYVDSLYYFKNPLDTLNSARKHLKTGGILFVRVTNRNFLLFVWGLLSTVVSSNGMIPFWVLGDALTSFSPKGLKLLLDKMRFKEIKLYPDHGAGRRRPLPMRIGYRLLYMVSAITRHRILLTPGLIAFARK